MELEKPVVYKWREKTERPDEDNIINTDNIIECAEWCKSFAINRLDNDVGLALERVVVGSYQIGYLFDQIKMKDGQEKTHYLEENIASALIHLIASYEMTGREFFKIIPSILYIGWSEQVILAGGGCLNKQEYLKGKSQLLASQECLYYISENLLKYQRWMLYHHMKRTKRWDEKAYIGSLFGVCDYLFSICYINDCDLSMGFALAMSKLQDSEIKRH